MDTEELLEPEDDRPVSSLSIPELEGRIAALEQAKEAVKTRSERSEINVKLHACQRRLGGLIRLSNLPDPAALTKQKERDKAEGRQAYIDAAEERRQRNVAERAARQEERDRQKQEIYLQRQAERDAKTEATYRQRQQEKQEQRTEAALHKRDLPEIVRMEVLDLVLDWYPQKKHLLRRQEICDHLNSRGIYAKEPDVPWNGDTIFVFLKKIGCKHYLDQQGEWRKMAEDRRRPFPEGFVSTIGCPIEVNGIDSEAEIKRNARIDARIANGVMDDGES